MSFGDKNDEFESLLFPQDDTSVVTAFWSDIQISVADGSIFYHLYNDLSSDVIKRAGREITAFTGAHFEPAWVLVATWHQVPKYQYSKAGSEVRALKSRLCEFIIFSSVTPFKLFLQRTTFLRMLYTIIHKMDCSGRKVPTTIRVSLATRIQTLAQFTTILFLKSQILRC